MRSFNRDPSMYHNESPESRGTELEKTYAKLLGGRIVGGIGDDGLDIVFDENLDVPLIQVKSSYPIALKCMAKSVSLNEFLPIVIGDPGQYKKEEIFKSIIENGGWVGIDVGDREKLIGNIKSARDLILVTQKGKQKGVNFKV